MSNALQSPDEMAIERVRRGWLDDGPRFVLVAWGIATLAMTVISIGVLVGFSIFAVVGAALGGEKSSDRFAEVAKVSIGGPGATWTVLIVSQISLFACMYLACRLQRKSLWARTGLNPTGLSVTQGCVLLIATAIPFGLGLAAATMASSLLGATPESELGLRRMWSEGSRGSSVVWIALIAFLPGFVEEIFYRGFLQRGLLMRWGPLRSILTSSLLFAAVHGDPVTAIAIFPFGVWLGIVAWRTNSIRMTFLMHAVVNGLWTGLMILIARDVVSEAIGNWIVVASFAVGLLAFPQAIQILRTSPMNVDAISDSSFWAPGRSNLIRSPFVLRLIGGAVVGAAAFFLLIPAGHSPIRTIDVKTLVAPTWDDLELSVVKTIKCRGFGNDYTVEFQLEPKEGLKVALPTNRVGIEHVFLMLDADGKTVWLAYNGDITGKNTRGRPAGIVEQLTSGDPTTLHMSVSQGAVSAKIRLTVEQTEDRKAELFAQAWSSSGWAVRSRK